MNSKVVLEVFISYNYIPHVFQISGSASGESYEIKTSSTTFKFICGLIYLE